ncbi:MAG: glycosyltransferase family 4 protein [Alistipes sp.]|nr:glycosyltransferase family 4 protein [Alistipes sp.]
MKILFDHQIFASQTYGGVSRYFTEVIRRLPRSMWEVSATHSNNHYARLYGVVNCREFLPHTNFRHKGRLMAELGKPYSKYRLRYGEYDVFHPTNFDTYCLSSHGIRPMVVTYHDTNFITAHNPNRRMERLQRMALARADRVIAVSENTRRDILQHFDIAPERVCVIHHGVSRLADEEFAYRAAPARPYILYVGLRHSFKNFRTFALAFSLIAHRYPDLKVVCTREAFNGEEMALFRRLGIAERMQSIAADEPMLARLYTNARLFVFPSRYEGFGMPILEAMAYGCPCALSDSSCFPEIAGDAATYFPSDDAEAMADAIDALLTCEELRSTLRQRGRERVKQFTWERSAKQHLNLYLSLA